MGNKIVVIGSSNTDMIIKHDRFPKPGETVIGGTFHTAPGGKGANQAVAAARADGDIVFVARVGDDIFGQQAIEGFMQDGINVDYVIKDEEAPSGVAFILLDKHGENSISVASGANESLSPHDVEASQEVIASAGIVLMQLETPLDTVRKAADIASANGVTVILNPAPAQSLDSELLAKIDVLTPNETEAEMLTGITVDNEENAEKASLALRSHGIGTVIITLGARGVYVSSASFSGMVSGFKVTVVDTTAAGDTFNGVLAVALVEGMAISDAVRFANAASALSVTQLGAQTSAPLRSSIESFLKEQE